MTPEVEKKRRELFEAWVAREWPTAPLHYVRDALPKNDPRYGEYCDESLQRAWVGWNAALSALEIHTPGKLELADSPGSMAWNHCIDEYTRNITATGLGLRIK
jgi:hypothetical protein